MLCSYQEKTGASPHDILNTKTYRQILLEGYGYSAINDKILNKSEEKEDNKRGKKTIPLTPQSAVKWLNGGEIEN